MHSPCHVAVTQGTHRLTGITFSFLLLHAQLAKSHTPSLCPPALGSCASPTDSAQPVLLCKDRQREAQQKKPETKLKDENRSQCPFIRDPMPKQCCDGLPEEQWVSSPNSATAHLQFWAMGAACTPTAGPALLCALQGALGLMHKAAMLQCIRQAIAKVPPAMPLVDESPYPKSPANEFKKRQRGNQGGGRTSWPVEPLPLGQPEHSQHSSSQPI